LRDAPARDPKRKGDVGGIQQKIAGIIADEAHVETDEHPTKPWTIVDRPGGVGLRDGHDRDQVGESKRDLQPHVRDVRRPREHTDGEIDPQRPGGQNDEHERKRPLERAPPRPREPAREAERKEDEPDDSDVLEYVVGADVDEVRGRRREARERRHDGIRQEAEETAARCRDASVRAFDATGAPLRRTQRSPVMSLSRTATLVATLALLVAATSGASATSSGTVAAPDSDNSAERAYCTQTGGAIVRRYAVYGTNGSNPLRLDGVADFCQYAIKKDGSRIHLLLDTLYAQKPTLAALAYYAKVQPNPGCQGNPASCYCSQLGGSDLFGGVNAAGGGWVNKHTVDQVLEACIFPDKSSIDSWGLTYHSQNIIRGVDLSKVLRYKGPPQ
jgi:hypothetical protein